MKIKNEVEKYQLKKIDILNRAKKILDNIPSIQQLIIVEIKG